MKILSKMKKKATRRKMDLNFFFFRGAATEGRHSLSSCEALLVVLYVRDATTQHDQPPALRTSFQRTSQKHIIKDTFMNQKV